ncbi:MULTISPECIES: CYTH domain-containing protein [Halomonadaceae]|uniref:CYTH domain-containing protein n=1 Tax=Vreelandella halophila TaxID=86177 RepID=A0A9X5B6M6_9GAMM|nr:MULTISPECIES: CYTH domain-containing protein [Halomonas]MYL27644.1 CYTH domain-containing protein [Halomonas utahensis]MYL75374.1 CYTH domain-containing protein [Halomonas sp. 22501_18_FS]
MSETELKLSMTPANLDRAGGWLSTRGAVEQGEPLTLLNRYYDTPEGALNAERVALRVRATGSGYIQTLKTRGHLQGAALARQEWEWERPEASLDLALMADTPMADHPALSHLAPVFDTDFQRRVLMLDWSEQGQWARIECALDNGVIRASGQEQPLCELELELVEGDAGILSRVATALTASVPALLNSISKAEQGYHLAGVGASGEAGSGASPQVWLDALCRFWLGDDPAGWEHFLQLHRQLSGSAEAAGAGEAYTQVTAELESAAAQCMSPREALTTMRGLAPLQLALLV